MTINDINLAVERKFFKRIPCFGWRIRTYSSKGGRFDFALGMETTCDHHPGTCIPQDANYRPDYWQRIQDADKIIEVLGISVKLSPFEDGWLCELGHVKDYSAKGETRSQAIVAAALKIWNIDVIKD